MEVAHFEDIQTEFMYCAQQPVYLGHIWGDDRAR